MYLPANPLMSIRLGRYPEGVFSINERITSVGGGCNSGAAIDDAIEINYLLPTLTYLGYR